MATDTMTKVRVVFFFLENFLDDFTSTTLGANATLQEFPVKLAAGSSTVWNVVSYFWHTPKFVQGVSATALSGSLGLFCPSWGCKRNLIHVLTEDIWSKV